MNTLKEIYDIPYDEKTQIEKAISIAWEVSGKEFAQKLFDEIAELEKTVEEAEIAIIYSLNGLHKLAHQWLELYGKPDAV